MTEDVQGHGLSGNVNESVEREEPEDVEGHGLEQNVNESVEREDAGAE